MLHLIKFVNLFNFKRKPQLPVEPPQDICNHFFANPEVPIKRRVGFMILKEEQKDECLKNYWAELRTGKFGGYKPCQS